MSDAANHPTAFQQAIEQAKTRQDLSVNQTSDLIDSMLKGEADEQQVADLLLALKEKGESVSELVGAARAMRAPHDAD